MTPLRLFLITLFFLILTVPWWFSEPGESTLLGFPSWALYSLGTTVFYMGLIAFCLRRFWFDGTEEGTEHSKPGRKDS